MVYIPYEAAEWYVLNEWEKRKPLGDEASPEALDHWRSRKPNALDARIQWFRWLDWYPTTSKEYYDFVSKFPSMYSIKIHFRGAGLKLTRIKDKREEK